MTIAYFDCFSGAAGDMILGALLDAGADLQHLQHQLDTLDVEGCTVAAEKRSKAGFACTKIHVLGEGAPSPHRHFSDICRIIESGSHSPWVRERAIAIFERLARAEATVHGCDIKKVHFHEVGAVDAIADIVGAVIAMEQLGITRVVCSPMVTGSGTVRCAHGELPVPAPATAILLEGVPLQPCDETGELTTPTGAAILTTLADAFGPMPAMTIRRIGYGAGTREGKSRPNLLRVLLGDPADAAQSDEITVLEASIDDSTPEMVAYCLERLLDAGVLDAYATPIYMKKSRPGVCLTVLAEHSRVADVERIMFAETTTLGIRRHTASRTKAVRRIATVDTAYGPIRLKVGDHPAGTTASPEYEDAKAAARKHNVPLRTIMEESIRIWQQSQ